MIKYIKIENVAKKTITGNEETPHAEWKKKRRLNTKDPQQGRE